MKKLPEFLNSLITASSITDVSAMSFFICIAMALGFGLLISLAYNFKHEVSKSFSITLALLPPTVALVIMMVNGSIGAGIAVAGSFSLIRFRSLPGTGREIVGIFLAMAAGITAGMGYVVFGLIFTIFIILALIILENTIYKEKSNQIRKKTIRIMIPEDLDYENVFSEILNTYCKSFKLSKVKTVNLGSLMRLTYDVELAPYMKEKELIDELRIRNGNLEISSSLQATEKDSL